MRLTAKLIRKIILEEMEAQLDEKLRLPADSVDDQIDALLIKFESESIKTESVTRSLSALLFEAPEDDDEEGPSAVGSEERDQELSAEPIKPPVEIDQFTKKVVRLLENYESLLDIKTVIINRARNYLIENYDEAAADALEDTLDTDYGISLNPPDNDPTRPIAVGAAAKVGA